MLITNFNLRDYEPHAKLKNPVNGEVLILPHKLNVRCASPAILLVFTALLLRVPQRAGRAGADFTLFRSELAVLRFNFVLFPLKIFLFIQQRLAIFVSNYIWLEAVSH